MKTYKVKKGKHKFSPRPFKLFWSKKQLKFEFSFNESNIYELPNENYGQWNKLCGLSDFNCYHHDQSVRIGWRGDIDGIECALYVRVDSEFKWVEFKHKFQIGRKYSGSLNIEKDKYTARIQLGGFSEQVSHKRYISTKNGINYLLTPYFGGKYEAPHDMDLKLLV